MDEIATKLLQATNDPNKYEATLTITGAGGFGKTTMVISLCHYPVVNKHFTDGFVFIELGPQATDPSIKLRDIYNLLTGEQCGINAVEQKIYQLTSEYYHNLLVIIDDVWHVEDAEPLVKAFSNCKTILTTRMNDIEQYIPSKQSVIIGEMTQHEAIALLTSGVIDSSQLSQEDVSLLDELAQNVHLWPLLLSLVRGQLLHNLKLYHFSHRKAIENVQTKLYRKGLTGFDRNIIDSKKSRQFAVKACIGSTLQLLKKPLSDKIKILILWTGIGTSLQLTVLNRLWNISEQEAEQIVDALWAYGLIQFANVTIFPNHITQHCVEVHTVISQYIIDYMDSNEVSKLSPFFGDKLNTVKSVWDGLKLTFQQSYGVQDLSSLTPIEFLKYKAYEIETIELLSHLKIINMHTVTHPHFIILSLQDIQDILMKLPYGTSLLSFWGNEANALIMDCKKLISNAHILCRKLNQSIQKNLYEKDFNMLIHTVEEFIKTYHLCILAQKAITLINKILPYCDGELQHYIMGYCEHLQMKTADYHTITSIILPVIKLHIKLHKQITNSLANRSPNTEQVYNYIVSGKLEEELQFVNINSFIKLQEVAPRLVQNIAPYYM